MRALLVIAIACTAGCLRQTEFKCAADTDCSASGAVCQSTGYCSFSDAACTTGQRYGDFAGSYAGQCVDTATMADAGVDMMVDALDWGNCPMTYMPLPGAGPHLYKLTTNAQSWLTQYNRCDAEGAYLALPDNMAELQAITTASAAARTWVGITDLQNEGTFVTVRGSAPTFVPWASGEPDNPGSSGGEDCVSALMSSPSIATDRCSLSFAAVCECEP